LHLVDSSVDECIALPNLLRFVPLDAVDSLMFASSEFQADDLVKILEPDYDDDSPSNLQHLQRELFEKALPQILKTWELTNQKMLLKFLSFTTGLTYLPIVRDFRICIKFEKRTVEGNSSSADRLPESHTCVQTLSIPSAAYGGDFKVFEAKLACVVESDYDKFTQI